MMAQFARPGDQFYDQLGAERHEGRSQDHKEHETFATQRGGS